MREVDNVPLLVSLFTDSTSETIKEMVNVFKENGEVVLCVGSSCRLQNNSIFRASDLAVAVATLPGDKGQIPVDIGDLINRFPSYNRRVRVRSNGSAENEANINNHKNHGSVENNDSNADNNRIDDATDLGSNSSWLCRDDLLLHYRLVGLGTAPLLQLPPTLAFSTNRNDDNNNNNNTNNNNNNNNDNSNSNNDNNNNDNNDNSKSNYMIQDDNNKKHLRLSALLEGVHMGRIYLVNSLQVGAFIAVSCLSMSLWSLVSCALPLSIPPFLPPSMTLFFLFIYIPLISFSILFGPGPDGVMKATPRKNMKMKNIQNNNEIHDDDDNDNDDDDIKNKKVYEMEILLQLQQKQRKRKDEKRFFSYLLIRCLYVTLSLFATGWLACGGIFRNDDQILQGVEARSYKK